MYKCYYAWYENGQLWLDGVKKRMNKPSQLTRDVVDSINVHFDGNVPHLVKCYIDYRIVDNKPYAVVSHMKEVK